MGIFFSKNTFYSSYSTLPFEFTYPPPSKPLDKFGKMENVLNDLTTTAKGFKFWGDHPPKTDF